eukprot:scaffold1727_cov133-Cylindrotheca_fusiformis.AAC.38
MTMLETSEFEFLNISFSERIQDDERLWCFYGRSGLKSIAALHRELLAVTLRDEPKQEDTMEAVHRLLLQYHKIWLLGFNGTHYDILCDHFADAMRYCWIDEKLQEIFTQRLEKLRPYFEQSGRIVRMADRHEDAKVTLMSMAVNGRMKRSSMPKRRTNHAGIPMIVRIPTS